ncbi:MAG: CASTOR/POLLUX-related putative ion channel [Gaiellaceae bacterium]
MSRGSIAMIGGLGAISLLLVGSLSAIVALDHLAPVGDGGRPGMLRDFFITFLHTIDPGAIAHEAIGEGVTSWPFLLAMLGVTIGGILLVSTLIGVIAAGLDQRMQDLRKGRSFVVEDGHILILGWSPTIFTVVSELVIANASERRSSIVVLARRDKVEMEDALAAKVRDFGKTRIVVRSGNPADPDDLALVNPHGTRSIIVLAEDRPDPDGQVLKTVLAITLDVNRREEPYHIVAVISDSSNLEAAALVGRSEAIFIDCRDTVARLVVQAARQPGASLVYRELLQYEGDEIYFREDETFVGRDYAATLFAYENASTIGLERGGAISLNPPPETVVGAGDRVIAIAEDDSTLTVAPRFVGTVETEAIALVEEVVEPARRILMLGWNDRAPTMVSEIDQYSASGTELTIASEFGTPQKDMYDRCPELANLVVSFEEGSTSQRRRLEELHPESYDQIIVLCYGDHLHYDEADGKTLITLLHLRELSQRCEVDLRIATEMLDDRNRKLAEVTNVDDIIVSDEFVSLLLSQISESGSLHLLFDELLAVDGAQIHLRRASNYVDCDRPLTFGTLIEAATRRNETAFGYRVAADARNPERSYGIHVNPPKSALLNLAPGDCVVVLATEQLPGSVSRDPAAIATTAFPHD